MNSRRRRTGILGVALLVCGLVVGALPAQAEVAAAPGVQEQVAVPAPGVKVAVPSKALTGKHSVPFAAKGETLALAPGSARMVAGAESEVAGCTPYISGLVTPDGAGSVRIDFAGELVCNFYLAAAGQAYLIDRTASSSYNGAILATGNVFSFGYGYYAYSVGSIIADGRIYDGARQLEIGFNVTVQTLNGAVWAGCFELPNGQRYLAPCSGVGSPQVQASVGSGVFNSGLAPFNPAATIRDSAGIELLTFHIGGQDDPSSTARQNIVDAAAGRPARTTFDSDVGATDVFLGQDLLRGMVNIHLLRGFNYRVTTIAGGNHMNPLSRHYVGKAFDVDRINGVPVNASNPNVAAFRAACEAYGATEVRGPGDAGHASHIHCAWPR